MTHNFYIFYESFNWKQLRLSYLAGFLFQNKTKSI